MSRDPRVDPRPGDVLEKNSLSRTVLDVRGMDIVWGRRDSTSKPNIAWISTWREWARTATILHTAEAP